MVDCDGDSDGIFHTSLSEAEEAANGVYDDEYSCAPYKVVTYTPKQEWVPVSERPENYRECHVAFIDDQQAEYLGIDYMHDIGDRDGLWMATNDDDITHWCYVSPAPDLILPQPPKESE